MVFQGAMNAFNPVKTIGAQIAEPMELHGFASRKEARLRVGELLELVGISADRADRYPHEFSGGMRQRAAIAMALACAPKVLLADEPTTALDVMVQAQILELLMSLSSTLGKELGLTVILVTHDLPIVAQVCDRAAVMYAGEIVEMAEMSTIYHDPRHPYTRMLFAATPDLLGDDEVISIPGAPPRLDREIVGCPFRPRCDSAFEPCATVHPRRARAEAAASGALPSQRRDDEGGLVTAVPAHGGGSARCSRSRIWSRSIRSRGGSSARSQRRPRLTVHAVDGVSFSVGEGEMVALVGESGCGKTSTAQTVIRMVESNSGSIRFRGTELGGLGARELRPFRREIQIIYQDPYESLDPRFTVRDTIEEPIRVHGLSESESAREAKVHEAMERAGLTPPELFIDRFPHELSGGQRQRVAIAAALVLEPKLLIADEPVSMLDVSVRAGILALLDSLRKRRDGRADDHARPLDGGALRRPHRRDVPRPDRGGGAGAGRRPQPAASVHEGADLGRPAARPAISRRRRRSSRARRRIPSTCRPAAGSIPAVRWPSTGAGRSTRSCVALPGSRRSIGRPASCWRTPRRRRRAGCQPLARRLHQASRRGNDRSNRRSR